MRFLPLLALLALFTPLPASGCETDTPQNTFDARGEVAEKQRDLFYLAMWPALVIMILVLLAIVVMILRFRGSATLTSRHRSSCTATPASKWPGRSHRPFSFSDLASRWLP